MPLRLSGLKPAPSMIEPGTKVPAGVKPPGPTPWMRTWWCTIRFSVYSPCGSVAVGAFGQTTTSQYLLLVVGLAASSALWIVAYGLPGPTSASAGLAALLAAEARSSTWIVRLL